jgi:phenylpropionate dioxygenase-like ring-hydroxylating dioxygenase large terminal subunit
MTGRRHTHSSLVGPAPQRCWYPVAAAADVGRSLQRIEALGQDIVLFRTLDGAVAALEDCCAHRPYPLSLGRLAADAVVCGLCGFEYGPTGHCLGVPTQDRIPAGASVRSFIVREQYGTVWLWFGERANQRPSALPKLGWLDATGWTTVSGARTVAANYLLLHESFADVTKIAVLAPDIAPYVLRTTPPPLDVVVTETTVSLERRYPPTQLPAWQAEALGVDDTALFVHEQQGHFRSPAVWVDHWDVVAADEAPSRLRFSHFVTPVDERTTRLGWWISRDFATDTNITSRRLIDMFTPYYNSLGAALERSQLLLDRRDRHEVNVSADVAALRVREIVRAMLSEEGLDRSAP